MILIVGTYITNGDYVELSLYGPIGHYSYNEKIESFKTHAMKKALPISLASILHDDFINKGRPGNIKLQSCQEAMGSLHLIY
jgi:hypothetical protein